MDKLSAKLPASLQVGKDGVSPIVKVGEIAGGHRITITDVNGEITFDVPDGKDGKSAYDYAVEAGYTGDSATFAGALVAALDRPALLYAEQNLTPEQQAQARANIGAAAVGEGGFDGDADLDLGGHGLYNARVIGFIGGYEIVVAIGENENAFGFMHDGDVVELTCIAPGRYGDSAATVGQLNAAVGDISAALDEIHAYAEALKGGDSE